MGGRTFERIAHFQQLHLKKGGGRIFEGGLILGDYGKSLTAKSRMVSARHPYSVDIYIAILRRPISRPFSDTILSAKII